MEIQNLIELDVDAKYAAPACKGYGFAGNQIKFTSLVKWVFR